MKKNYNQPIVETMAVQGAFLMTDPSTVIDNNMTQIPGGVD